VSARHLAINARTDKMLKYNLIPWLLPVLAALLLALPEPAATQDRVPADAATTSQKAEFVEHLVTRSVSVTRIEESGDAAAMESLARSRALVDQAKADLKSGAIEAADDKLDQALALLNSEVRRLSGSEVRGAHDKAMYERRLKAVNTFLTAYERVADEGSSRAASKQAKSIRALTGKAQGAAAKGQYEEAIEILDKAYVIARGDIREMRQGKTLTRTLDFATAEEEYDYELGRNRSHFLLLQFALSEKTPAGSVAGRIKSNRTSAEGLRSDAEKKASAGAYPDAIDLLNKSTEMLLKTIRMSGIFVPG
jgi:tetratricopeptide (TPR) repeat protein